MREPERVRERGEKERERELYRQSLFIKTGIETDMCLTLFACKIVT